MFLEFSNCTGKKANYRNISMKNLKIKMYIVNYDVKKYEILEQQITTSKLEGIHNCADRTDKFVSN
jgi:hypothetical protein